MRGLFVTATDTGVGKTVLSAALLAAMAAAGERVRAYKPVVTGLEEADPDAWAADHELLGAVAGMSPDAVAPTRFGPAVSPHLAAELAGRTLDPAQLLAEARGGEPGETVIVEGVGGLLVPLGHDFTICDLAGGLSLGLVIAARTGLGTINHTLLTLRVARGAGLQVRAVVLTPWPTQPTVLELSNRDTIARMGAVDVHTLPLVSDPAPETLARAGETLPWRRWLQAPA
jgi:dethiobiotin synthetase